MKNEEPDIFPRAWDHCCIPIQGSPGADALASSIIMVSDLFPAWNFYFLGENTYMHIHMNMNICLFFRRIMIPP